MRAYLVMSQEEEEDVLLACVEQIFSTNQKALDYLESVKGYGFIHWIEEWDVE